MAHLREHISPSQLKDANRCLRRWHGKYCCGWTEEEKPWHRRGKIAHKHVEYYLKHEIVPKPGVRPWGDDENRERDGAPWTQQEIDSAVPLALALMRGVPRPRTPYLLVEQEILIPKEILGVWKDLYGYLDYAVLWQAYTDDVTGFSGFELLVGDNKTTSSLEYMLASEQLKLDFQALLYGLAALIECRRTVGRDPDRIRFQHNYVCTKGAAQHDMSECCFTPTELLQLAKQRVPPIANKLQEIQDLRYAEVEATGYPDACGDYRGCANRTECAQTGLTMVYGDKPNGEAVAHLLASRANEKVRPFQQLPQEKEMPRPASKFAAAARAAAGLSPDATAPTPAAPEAAAPAAAAPEAAAPAAAAPESSAPPLPPEILTPPDGDKNNEAGETRTSADLTNTANVEDDLAGASDDVPAADGGYQAKTAPEPEAPAAGRKGRPSVLPELREKVSALYGQITSDARLTAKLQQVQHPLVSVLLDKGKLPQQAGSKDMQQLIDIMQAVVDDMPPPVSTTVADNTFDADPAVAEAQQNESFAQANLAAARSRSAEVLKLIAKAQDEKRYADLGTLGAQAGEVEEQIKAFELQLTTAQAAVATAKADALERKAQADRERQARERREAQAAVQQNEQVRQTQAPVQAPSQGGQPAGLPFPLLIYGGVPIRGVRFTDLTDLVTPFRRKVEAAAGVHHYLAMKGNDASARIAEELVAALTSGDFRLPDVITAGRYLEGPESACAKAIEPFCNSIVRASN